MKKWLTILIYLLTLEAYAFGQVTKDSYGKAVDYFECEILEVIYAGDSLLEGKFAKSCPCDSNITSMQLDAFLNKYSSKDSKTIDLHKEIGTMKAQSYDSKLSLDEATEYLTSSVFEESKKYQKIFQFAKTRRDKNSPLLKKLLNTLGIEVPKILKVEMPVVSVETSTIPKGHDVPSGYFPPDAAPLEQSSSSFSWILAILSIFTVLIVTFIAYRKIKYLEEEIGKLYGLLADNPGSGKKGSEISGIKSELVAMKTDISSILQEHRAINSITKALEILQQQVDLHDRILERIPQEKDSRSNNTSFPLKLSTNPSTKEILYLSTPNRDGSFGMSSASSIFKEGASVYRFERQGDLAYFQLDEHETAMKAALLRPEMVLNPVCRAMNAKSPNSTRIGTQSQGRARLEGDRWIVDESDKAVIKYED